MPLIVNPVRSVEEDVRRVREAVDEVVAAFPEDALLISDIRKLEEYGIQMAHYAPEYDFQDVQGNGFRALLQMGIKLMKFSIELMVTRGQRQHYNNFKKITHTYVNVIPYLERMRQESRETESVAIFGDILLEFFVDYIQSPEERRYPTTMMGCYNFGFKTSKWMMRYFFWISIRSTYNIKEFLSCLFSSANRRRIIDRTLNSFDVKRLRDFTGQNSWLTVPIQKTLIPWYTDGTSCRERREFLIPRQEQLKLYVDLDNSTVTVVKRTGIPETNSVRCRFLHEPLPDVTPTTLLINVHGGGYCIGTVYNNDVYLRYWAAKIAGKLAVLSIDISLAPEHRFPAQIQEVVDVFLFLTRSTDQEVIDRLGFKPDKIILSGDSSGACFVLAATVALSEMRKRWPQDIPVMPTSIFSFYGSFSVAMMMLPSYMICASTVFLSGINFAIFVESYVPITSDVNQNVIKEEGELHPKHNMVFRTCRWIGNAVVKTFKWFLNISRYDGSDAGLWAPGDVKRLKERIAETAKLVGSPHISPLNYEDFESLSGISLFLFAGRTDPVLDHSIVLAHRWKGEVLLEVSNNQHGYLNLIGFDSKARQSCDRIAEKLKSLVDS